MSEATLKRLLRAEFDYEATQEEEIGLTEGTLVFLLDDSDQDWWKVRLKLEAGLENDAAQEGLCPASYLAVVDPIQSVKATYEFDASNSEELSIAENEDLFLYINEGDWALVGRADGEGCGYVPASYLDSSQEDHAHDAEQPQAVEEEPEAIQAAPAIITPVAPISPVESVKSFAPPPLHPHRPTGDVTTFPVSSLDPNNSNRKKASRKKGTLGIGNGALFFTSESDKSPVQQVAINTLTSSEFDEKNKIVELAFENGTRFVFETKSKGDVAEISEKLASLSTGSDNTPAQAPVMSSANGKSSAGGHDGKIAIVQYDFSGEGEDELSVQADERVLVINSSDSDWWMVQREHARTAEEQGVVPASFLEIDASAQASSSTQRAVGIDEEQDAADLAQIQADEAHARALQRREEKAARREEEAKALSQARGINYNSEPVAPPMPPRGRAGSSSDSSQYLPKSKNNAPQIAKPSTPALPEITKTSATADKRSKPSPNKTRIWKDRTGQFRVEAQFLGLQDGKVRLHKSNGVVIDVPMEKMSPEDVKVISSIMGARQRGGVHPDELGDVLSASPPLRDREGDRDRDRERERERRHRDRARRSSKDQMNASTSSDQPPPQPPRPQAQSSKKTTVDWFDFFLNAGCDLDDCTRYARNFDRDRIDEEVLPELEASTLRSLGLREGDLIRVRRYIKQKYGSSAAMPSTEESGSPNVEKDSGPLFTGPSGGLKTTRRGRPLTEGRQHSGSVSADTLAAATDQLSSSRTTTPDLLSQQNTSSSSSASVGAPKRSSSTQPITNGFDDDAWTVKSSRNNTPAPAPAAQQAPTPEPPQVSVERTKSAAPVSTTSLSDSILANMGITDRPPSAPVQRQTSMDPGALSNYAVQAAYNPNAPRGPVAPLASNAPLLNPLIPTNTSFSAFVPTRPASNPPMPVQMTGYPLQQPFQQIQPQPQFQQAMMPQASGYVQPAMMAQAAGYPQMSMPMSMPAQMTGMYTQSMAQNQPANMISQQTSLYPPNMAQQQPPTSTPANRYEPGNVFAAMKQGTAHTQQMDAMPQPEQRYDALRPQPTGFASQSVVYPAQPQMTGFVPQQQMQTCMPMQGFYRPAVSYLSAKLSM